MTKYETRLRKWIARDIKEVFEFAVLSHTVDRKFNDPFMKSMLCISDSLMKEIMHLHRYENSKTYALLGQD